MTKTLRNAIVTNATFDEEMKLADITPIFKKDESFSKENYRPISFLPPDLRCLKEFYKNKSPLILKFT